MDVYVVELGKYDERDIAGIYSSLDKAMAAHPPRPIHPRPEGLHPTREWEREGGWQEIAPGQFDSGLNQWDNGLDDEDAGVIRRFVLDERSV